MAGIPPVLDVIRERRSLRKFDDRPVEREKLLACLEAARLAPSAEHAQPWRFIAIEDPGEKADFGRVAFSGIYASTRWALKAPVLLAILADLNFLVHRAARVTQTVPFYHIDIGIAGEHLALQAQKLGLGTCWIGWFAVRRTQKYLKLPAGVRVVELMTLGYPPPGWTPKPQKRLTLDQIAFQGRWGNPIGTPSTSPEEKRGV